MTRRHRRKPFGTFSGLGGPSLVDQPPLSAVPVHGLKRKSIRSVPRGARRYLETKSQDSPRLAKTLCPCYSVVRSTRSSCLWAQLTSLLEYSCIR